MISLAISFLAKKSSLFQKSGKPKLITEKRKLAFCFPVVDEDTKFPIYFRRSVSYLRQKKKVDFFQSVLLSKSARGTLVTVMIYCIKDLASKISTLATGKY